MDRVGDSSARSNDSSSSASSERVVVGPDGATYKVRTGNNAQDTRGYGTPGGDSEGTGESAPHVSRPNPLGMFGWNEETQQPEKSRNVRGPGAKNIVGPKTTPGINAKTCGNIVGGIADAVSFVLTRTPVLGLNEQEEREMGESLFETVSNFPATSASVKVLNYLAPWAGLLHTSSKIVWKRLAFINAHKVKTQQQRQQQQQELFPNERGVVFAPDPSLVN